MATAARPGSSSEDRQSNTVGELLVEVLGKELCHIWLRKDPGTFDLEVLHAVMARVGPSLASDMVELIQRWVPGLGSLECRTLLPDLRKFPPEIEDCPKLELAQRKLIAESLEVLLTGMQWSFAADDREWRHFLQQYHETVAKSSSSVTTTSKEQEILGKKAPRFLAGGLMSFPAESVAAVCGAVTLAVEHVLMFRPQVKAAAAGTLEALVRGGDGGALALGRGEDDAAGAVKEQLAMDKALRSKEGLISELQRARRRMFEMERELVAKEHKKAEQVAWERGERERETSQLMQLNSILEDRLRKRTEEVKEQKRLVEDGKRRVEHVNSLLLEKHRKIEVLEHALGTSSRMTEDVLEREREYGRRMLRLRLAEDQSMQSQKLRIEKLQRLIRTEQSGGSPLGDEIPLSLTEGESHIAAQAKETLEKVEAEFDSFFEQRQEKFREALETYERRLGEKKSKFESTCQELLKAEAMQACVVSAGFGKRQTRSIAAQVNFRSRPGELPPHVSSPSRAAENGRTSRGSVPLMDAAWGNEQPRPPNGTHRGRGPKPPPGAPGRRTVPLKPGTPRAGPIVTPAPVLTEAEVPPFTFDTRFHPAGKPLSPSSSQQAAGEASRPRTAELLERGTSPDSAVGGDGISATEETSPTSLRRSESPQAA